MKLINEIKLCDMRVVFPCDAPAYSNKLGLIEINMSMIQNITRLLAEFNLICNFSLKAASTMRSCSVLTSLTVSSTMMTSQSLHFSIIIARIATIMGKINQ